MSADNSLLPQKGNYRKLLIFKKAECIYDITFYFANEYLSANDRTIDQMIQAARSGKQNIVEGCSASTTSKETEIKLINVAKASFQELLVDYEDFLRVRGLQQWSNDNPKYQQTREVAREHNDSAYYRNAIQNRSAETIANIAITLIHQEDLMLLRYLDKMKVQFVREGSVREELSKARRKYKKENKE